MAPKTLPITTLGELANGQEADFFALLVSKEELMTRDGKPYFRVGFRDARRAVTFPIWGDSPWAGDCRDCWQVGAFYKIRAEYRETNYGPQLEIRKIRDVVEEDRQDGFDPAMCQARSRFDPEEMFDELLSIAKKHIGDKNLLALVVDLFTENRELLLTQSAATRNHHAYVGGFLEHVLSVTKTGVYLANKYDDYYQDLVPRLNKDLVIAGCMLHDIGKMRELEQRPEGAAYTPEGVLVGHILQGRDIVREAAGKYELSAETLLRLEHIIISHQRLPEWGSPKEPMTPEALLVHYADDIDAKYHMMYAVLRDDATPGPLTSNKNALRQKIYRGEVSP